MRVLLVTDWEGIRGGMEEAAVRMREALTAAGHPTTLVAVGRDGEGEPDRFVRAPTSTAARAVSQIANPSAAVALARARREVQPDVVHVFAFEHETSPVALAALRGLPLVATIHNYKPICPTAHRMLPDGTVCEQPWGVACLRSGCVGPLHLARDQPRYALIDAVLSRAAEVLVPSRWMAGRLAEHGINATALAYPVAAPPPSYRSRPADRPTFVAIARLLDVKGIDLALLALARLRTEHPDARLRIVGDGPDRDRLRRLADEVLPGDAVEWRGEVRGAADRMLADAWALVVPSRWEEAFGLVAAEAVMRGVWVIASRQGGLAESVVEGASGELVANGDVDQLVAAMRRAVVLGPIAVDPSHGREVRERHAPEAHAAALLAAYTRAGAAPVGSVA